MSQRFRHRVDSSRALLLTYGYGLCMGAADALPGVSGGTVALLFGFYSRLIGAITAITPQRVLTILGGYDPAKRSAAQSALDELDLAFLLPLGVGMVTAVALIAGAVSTLAETHPIALFGFFTGLIAASAIVLFRTLSVEQPSHGLAATGGITLALLVSANVFELPASGLTAIFIAGTLAISAMILPGISGALILILLGQYVTLSAELSRFLSATGNALLGEGPVAATTDPGTTVIVFVLGGLVGLLTIARAVKHALDIARQPTLLFLVGLIAGSIPAPLHNIGDAHAWTGEVLALTAGWAVVGALSLVALDRLAGGFEPD